MQLINNIKFASALSILALIQLANGAEAKSDSFVMTWQKTYPSVFSKSQMPGNQVANVRIGQKAYQIVYNPLQLTQNQITRVNPAYLPAQSLNPNSLAFQRAAAFKLKQGAMAQQASNATQATNVSQSQQAQQATQYRMPQESQPHTTAGSYTLPGQPTQISHTPMSQADFLRAIQNYEASRR